MQRIEVLVEERRLVRLLLPSEAGVYLNVRRRKLAGSRIVDLAARLGMKPQQVSDLIYGRLAFGRKTIERINAIDPEYDMVHFIGIVEKQKSSDEAS